MERVYGLRGFEHSVCQNGSKILNGFENRNFNYVDKCDKLEDDTRSIEQTCIFYPFESVLGRTEHGFLGDLYCDKPKRFVFSVLDINFFI